MPIESPYIAKIPFRKISSSNSDRIQVYNEEFLRAIKAEDADRQRLYENFRLYWGVNYGQWNSDVVQDLLNENRHPMTINFLSQKINTLAGALTSNQYDIQFIAINGDKSSLTESFHDIYLSDKNINKWDIAFLQCIKFGLIYQGVEQMYEVHKSYDDSDGSLRFRTMQPGFTTFWPDWKTDYSEDCEKAAVIAYKTVKQIAELYGMTTQELKNEIMLNRQIGQYFSPTQVDIGKNMDATFEGLKKVIEVHEMVNVETVRLFDYSKGPNGLAFPVMDPKKYENYLKAWGDANNVDWSCVVEQTYKDRILKIFTFCPEISFSKVLEDRPSDIQIRRLDLFPWSADRLNGKNRGIVDICKDVQQTINKHQSQKMHMINSAANGAMLLNENLTGGDAAKMDEIKKNKNNPAYINDVDLDGVKTPYVVMKDKPYDAALFQNEQILVDLLDLITPVPAAMSSRTESSKESGILYQSKVAIAEVGMKTLYESVKQHHLDKASAYYLQVQKTYREKYKRFYKTDGSGFIEINKSFNMDGQNVILNNISELPRCHVIIKEDPNGLIQRQMTRLSSTEMMNVMPPEMSLLRSWLALRVAKTIETSEEDKKELEMIVRMELMRAGLMHKATILTTTANMSQAELMIAQLDQQLQQFAQQLGVAPGEAPPQQMSAEGDMPVDPGMALPEQTGEPAMGSTPETGGASAPMMSGTVAPDINLREPTVGLLANV